MAHEDPEQITVERVVVDSVASDVEVGELIGVSGVLVTVTEEMVVVVSVPSVPVVNVSVKDDDFPVVTDSLSVTIGVEGALEDDSAISVVVVGVEVERMDLDDSVVSTTVLEPAALVVGTVVLDFPLIGQYVV